MSTLVLSGAGLASWYVSAHLVKEGSQHDVLFANVGQMDERLIDTCLEATEAKGIKLHQVDLRENIAKLGLELARCQGRYDNGYWNTTSMLRVGLVRAACQFIQHRLDLVSLSHGCVAFGNDQRRFERLTGQLAPKVIMRSLLAELSHAGTAPTRQEMIFEITDVFGLNASHDLERKATYSSDGSVIGCANESAVFENPNSDWTQAPFVMTGDPFSQSDLETVEIEISDGALLRIGDATGEAIELLKQANCMAGRHGIGRLGVMEDKIRGSKCRGVYEAPGLTLIGEAYRHLYQALLPGEDLARLRALSQTYAQEVYGGMYFTEDARRTRSEITQMTEQVSGTVHLMMRGGHLLCRSLSTDRLGSSVEQRFNHGGVVWENVYRETESLTA